MNDILERIDEFIELNNLEQEKYLSQIHILHELIDKYPEIRSYKYISRAVHNYYQNLNELVDADEKKYLLHQKVHLLLLIKKSIAKLNETAYSKNIKAWYEKYYRRVVKNVVNDKYVKESLIYTNGRFLKVQSVCTLFTIPVDPFLLDKDKLSIKFLFYGDLKQFFKGVYYLLFKFKGVKPFYKTHTNLLDVVSMQAFQEKGWRNMLLDVADLLKTEQEVKGVCGTSWFIDPVVKDISPKLSYINELLKETGSVIFTHNITEQTTKDALFFNPERKKLYEEGKYQPRNYLFVIPRKSLIDWSEKQVQES